MSGTDAFVDGTVTSSLDVEVRKEIQRLRSLLLFPNDVHLVTRTPIVPAFQEEPFGELVEHSVERWLSDRYVMINVTGSPALRDYPPAGTLDTHAVVIGEHPDGGYKLMASKGLVPKEDVFLPDTAGLLNSIERPGHWELLHRTPWSMADSDAKLMLAYTRRMNVASFTMDVVPVAVNEGIWEAFIQAYPGSLSEQTPLQFEYCPDRPYRVSQAGRTVGYIASAEFPDKTMRDTALGVAELVARKGQVSDYCGNAVKEDS